ncbi:MAG: DUF2239 family protein [Proteobacteria bacterium]|nr:DUF2239 family protein [Pseudomonadota bacterium]
MFNPSLRCSAFSGTNRIASGELRHVAMKAKQAFDASPERPVLVFDDADARTLELPLELPAADLLAWLSRPQPQASGAPETPRRPGRPKLGVVPREVTLLPRHWDWLAAQPGGASVALRKLVDEARKVNAGDDRRRAAQEASYRFILVMAGDAPGFEDAARALFAGDAQRFESLLLAWPEDVREHALWLATDAFAA